MTKKGYFYLSVFLVASLLFPVVPIAKAATKDVYPMRGISFICCSPPGGGYDIFARGTAPFLTKYLKEVSPGAKGGEIRLRNLSAASGVQAYNFVHNDAAPDGYTIGDFNDGMLFPLLYGDEKVPYDPRDFTWLGSLTREVIRVLISNKKRFGTWEEMVAKSKKEPLTFVVSAIGGSQHLDTIFAKESIGLSGKISAVRGTAELTSAILRGDADVAVVAYESIKPLIDSKEVNTLVTFSKERIISDIPSIGEKGYPDCLKYILRKCGRVWMAPPKLDPNAKRALIAALRKIPTDPDWLQFCKKMGAQVDPTIDNEMEEFIKERVANFQSWLPIFRKYGL
ncbi:MAG: tripartite tricarboxylate transporter substrate-binding protein [Deltaproteobacteria bacterium]